MSLVGMVLHAKAVEIECFIIVCCRKSHRYETDQLLARKGAVGVARVPK